MPITLNKTADEDLVDLVLPFLREKGLFVQEKLPDSDRRWVAEFIGAVKEKSICLLEVKDYIHYFRGRML
jgi:nondiscriminating glutamyl-tRNA synthetase